MALFRPSPVRVQPFFGYRSRERLRLTARVLRQRLRSFEPGRGGRLRVVRTMLGQFTSSEVPDVAVSLRVDGPGETLLAAEATSDAEGFVHFDLPLEPAWDLPQHPAWETATLSWSTAEGPCTANAHVLAPGLDGRLAVISDIDDTIIETGVTGGWRNFARNWRRIFAQLPDERAVVPGAAPFYGALGGGEVVAPGERRAERSIPATHRPFFYVSSSPWNLFAYLVAFQRAKGLPLGPLLLRDWGLNRATFGSASHGGHKREAIAGILALYPELRFALIGDDTQGDVPAFAEAVSAYPGRIAAVFLRTVAGEALTVEEEAAIASIRAAGVALWLGDSFAVGEQFLHALGFTPGGETEQIVKVVEKVGEAPAPG
jgi:phosphatidate phosphatase APP1